MIAHLRSLRFGSLFALAAQLSGRSARELQRAPKSRLAWDRRPFGNPLHASKLIETALVPLWAGPPALGDSTWGLP
jgi:hypothetical protein